MSASQAFYRVSAMASGRQHSILTAFDSGIDKG
jgi:hypothetical protein